jgi:hypothetical protein
MGRAPPFLAAPHTQPDMNHYPCSHAQSILAGTAKVKNGFIRVGNRGKVLVLSVVEVLAEVCGVFESHVAQTAEITQALASPLCSPALRRECLIALPGICATYGMLPSGYLVAGHLVVDYESTICVGGADVRYGTLDGRMVTVKSIPFDMTTSSGGSQEVMSSAQIWSCVTFSRRHQNAYREIIIWKNLNHTNILPLLGIDTSISPLSTLSAWTEYGSLRDYLMHFPNAPRSKLVR